MEIVTTDGVETRAAAAAPREATVPLPRVSADADQNRRRETGAKLAPFQSESQEKSIS